MVEAAGIEPASRRPSVNQVYSLVSIVANLIESIKIELNIVPVR